MQAKRGFTLVEILIVVVILGILAAIVIPQFTQASTEAKQNSLCSDLQTLRSQIELYKVQHNDTAPRMASFESKMIYCTDISGANASPASKVRDPAHGFSFGPYLERVPENPFNGLSALAAAPAATAVADAKPGVGELSKPKPEPKPAEKAGAAVAQAVPPFPTQQSGLSGLAAVGLFQSAQPPDVAVSGNTISWIRELRFVGRSK